MPHLRTEDGDQELLRAALDQVPFGIAVIDRHLRYVAINEALARSNGLTLTDYIGKTVPEALPRSYELLKDIYQRVLSGETVTESWSLVWDAGASDLQSAWADFHPVRIDSSVPDGPVDGIAVVFRDVSELSRPRRRLDRVAELRASLAEATTLRAVAANVWAAVAEETQLVDLTVGLVNQMSDDLQCARLRLGEPLDVNTTSRDGDSPLAQVIRSGRDLVRHDGSGTWVGLALAHAGGVLGVLELGWTQPRTDSALDLPWLGSIAAVTAQALGTQQAARRERLAARRAAALVGVAGRLNALIDENAIADVVCATILELSDAIEAGVFVEVEQGGDLRRLAVLGGLNHEERDRFDIVPADAELPVVHTRRSGQPIWLQTRQDWSRYPILLPALEATGWPTVAVTPLTVASEDEGRAFGSVYTGFRRGRRLPGADKQFLVTVGEVAAAALQRVRVGQAEAKARAALEVSESRLQFLARSGAVGIIESYEDRLVSANQAFLDLIGYAALPDGGLALDTLTPPEWADANERALLEVEQHGVCQPFEKEYWRTDGTRVPVLVSIAMFQREPWRGVATVIDLTGRKEAEARERAALHSRERLTRAVQSALFPNLSAGDSPYHLEVGYRTGDDRLALGGDFYDALPIEHGRLAVIVGDVSGHGPVAAATGASLRAAWRACVLNGSRIEELPRSLDKVLLSERDSSSLFATALLAVFAADGTVDIVTAGHPAPLLIRDGLASEVQLQPQLMLGVVPVGRAAVERLHLHPQDRLLLFTDGLIEGFAGPGGRERLGVDGLLKLLASLPGLHPDAVIEAAVAAHGAGLPDDVAVLLVGPRAAAPPETPPPTTNGSLLLTTELPVERKTIQDVRHRVEEALQGEPHSDTAVLVVSELVTNAMRHAAPPCRLTVESTDRGVRITVSDSSPREPVLGPPLEDNTSDSGRGLRMVDLLATTWGVARHDGGKSVWVELGR